MIKKLDFLKILPFNAKTYLFTFVVMALSVCYLLSFQWNTRMDYSFGYLTPVFVFYILFERKEKILDFFNPKKSLSPIDSTKNDNKFLKIFFNLFFFSMLTCAILTYFIFGLIYFFSGNKGAPTFGMTFGFSFASFAFAYFASAKNKLGQKKSLKERLYFTSLFIFPCFIWIISAPLFDSVERLISLKLLTMVSIVVYNLMNMFGYVVTIKGNVLEFPGGAVGVAEACSGIRSLTACLFAGSFLGAAILNKTWKKILLVGLSMFFAFLNNLLRAIFLSIWAFENGSDSISGAVHDMAGYFVLGLTVIDLLIVVCVLQISPVPKHLRQNNDKTKSK